MTCRMTVNPATRSVLHHALAQPDNGSVGCKAVIPDGSAVRRLERGVVAEAEVEVTGVDAGVARLPR